MKNHKTISILMVIVGILLFFVSLFGYELGIAQRESFGALQWSGTILGAAATVLGIVRLLKKK